MREVTRIVTTALAAAALSLAAAMPLVAAWRMPAEQSATQASIDAPGQQNPRSSAGVLTQQPLPRRRDIA